MINQMDKVDYYLRNALVAEKENNLELATKFRDMAEDVVDCDDGIVVEVDASEFEINIDYLIDNIMIK